VERSLVCNIDFQTYPFAQILAYFLEATCSGPSGVPIEELSFQTVEDIEIAVFSVVTTGTRTENSKDDESFFSIVFMSRIQRFDDPIFHTGSFSIDYNTGQSRTDGTHSSFSEMTWYPTGFRTTPERQEIVSTRLEKVSPSQTFALPTAEHVPVSTD
jgi:hypothetical protein